MIPRMAEGGIPNKEAHWQQDAMLELHNDDALWVHAMRASEEL